MLKAVLPNEIKFRGCVGSGRWTLCVGAGITLGITPSWFQLTHKLVNETFGLSLNEDEFAEKVEKSGWNLDAWIQACANHFKIKKKDDDFNLLIENALYGELLKKSEKYGLSSYIKKVLNHPKSASKSRVLEVCDFIEKEYPNSTLLQLVDVLIRAAKQGKAPTAIITFNADTLLETFIDLFLRREHYQGEPPYSHPKYYYKSIKRAKDMSSDKTFIYHCHGSILPIDKDVETSVNDSRDRLVFLEEQYLQVATTASSWPETLFGFHATTSNMIFLGLSMSDSNIRRWLASSEAEIKSDMEEISNGNNTNPRHLWIVTSNPDKYFDEIRLHGLLHLGVRPAYIENWSKVNSGLANMLALK